MFDLFTGSVGNVNVLTSDNGGHSNEQLTELALDKLISISDKAHPAIQAQARAFKDNAAKIMYHYITLARREERATIVQVLTSNGHKDLAEIIRRL